jgi:hypothetical protein
VATTTKTAAVAMATATASDDGNGNGDGDGGGLSGSFVLKQLNGYKGSGGNGNRGACTFWVGTYPWQEYNLVESSHFLSPNIHGS